MSIPANVHEAKSTLSKLIEDAPQGEEAVIARDGTPEMRFTPVQAVPLGRKGGRWAGSAKEVDARWWELDEEAARSFEESEIVPADPRPRLRGLCRSHDPGPGSELMRGNDT